MLISGVPYDTDQGHFTWVLLSNTAFLMRIDNVTYINKRIAYVKLIDDDIKLRIVNEDYKESIREGDVENVIKFLRRKTADDVVHRLTRNLRN
jgi:hypothetical protein